MPDADKTIPTGLFVQPGPVPIDFKKSVEDSLNALVPVDGRAVFLGVAKRDAHGRAGVALAFGWNVGKGWQLGSTLAWDGDVAGEVKVMKVWK